MQTFLPYRCFYQSMRTLDHSRLGNQVYREGITLLRGGWPNHPASKMWQGYEGALARYLEAGIHVLSERSRNYFTTPWAQEIKHAVNNSDFIVPPWLGDTRLHDSHRSNLLRKDPTYYGTFGWNVPDNLPYYWPVP